MPVPIVRVSLVVIAALVACVEYRPARTGEDSARAVAAAESARAAERRVDTVTRIDTVLRVDTVLLRDTLPALGEAPPAMTTDTTSVAVRQDTGRRALPAAPAGTSPSAAPPAPTAAAPVVTEADLTLLRDRGLRMPVQGIRAADVPSSFNELRGGGSRPHHAMDIMAPRGTPVLSATDGRVHKLFTSNAGGLSVYVLDPGGRFIYYYAHLDGYRDGLAEGQAVRAGDVLGRVGSTGNASPNAPHLHFAVARVDDTRRWWAGTPVDPKPFLR